MTGSEWTVLRVQKFFLLLWLGSREKAMSDEATSANAVMSLQYVML